MTLNELNFQKLIDYSLDNVNAYCFYDYRNNDYRHPNVVSYCTACEELGVNACDDENYYLCNISHGSHSREFLSSANIYDIDDWNSSGVMFVMESPSKDYGIYETVEIEKDGIKYSKRPSKLWYWIHGDNNVLAYPSNFKGGKYGDFVASAIVTFKLSNAYMTNLIKCGLNDPQNDLYKGIDKYDEKCIQCCFNNYLKNEIDIVKPKVIFTFGSSVYNKVKSLIEDSVKVVGLPHPAGQRRGFKDEYYNVLYFCMISKWLFKTGVISQEFYRELMEKFADCD